LTTVIATATVHLSDSTLAIARHLSNNQFIEEILMEQVLEAEKDVKNKFEVQVVYNGITKPVIVNLHQQVTAVVQHAAQLFGITQNVHLLSLFKDDGSEIADNQSVAAAGIKPCDLLALRPSTVKGG
jgi:hypothetical protein